jgi:hypothetical protein
MSINPLNPDLFDALQKNFGKVKIVNAGCEAHYTKVDNWFSAPLQRQIGSTKSDYRLDMWGESYSMCCPKCNDRRFRLYVSHVWGVYNEQAGRKFYPVKCHNENCDWRSLYTDLMPDGEKSFAIDLERLKRTEVQAKMEYPCNPENLIPVNKLENNHEVVQYLVSRNFCDLDLLANEYGFCYCADSPWKKVIKDSAGKSYLITPSNRLIIPNIQKGIWAGWQARYIGDIPSDPETGKPIIQKYLNAPGYSFGSSLYRLEKAIEFSSGKFCLVSEGVLSAVACGFAGICTFGMFPKPMQEELLIKHFCKGKIVFLVEYEAQQNGKIYACIQRLNSKIDGKAVAVDLPPGKDAANMDTSSLIELMQSSL